MTTPNCNRCKVPLISATARIPGKTCWECPECNGNCSTPEQSYGHDWQPRVGGLARYQLDVVQIVGFREASDLPWKIGHEKSSIWVAHQALSQPTLSGYRVRRPDGSHYRGADAFEGVYSSAVLAKIAANFCEGTVETVPAPDDPTPEEFARANVGKRYPETYGDWVIKRNKERPGYYGKWLKRLSAAADIELEAAASGFAHGNVSMHNPDVTRETVDRAAEKIRKGDQ